MSLRARSFTKTIISFATAWGPKFGGINAFNTELLKSLSLLPEKTYRLICVVQESNENDVAEAASCGIELINFAGDLAEASNQSAQACLELLKKHDMDLAAPVILLGHDDKTGPFTLLVRAIFPKCKAVLIHHMTHGAYQSFKKSSSAPALQKQKMQRDLFAAADLCLAVGPLLESQLNDLLATCVKRPPVRMLIPGLDDLDNFGVAIAEKTPDNFVAFVAGRLSKEDDRIKQGTLALRAFGNAVRRISSAHEYCSNALRQSPKLRMRGVLASEESTLAGLLKDSAGCELARDFADYTDDRNDYYTSLASASVALMPSWHEGFGLTAWEAIACSLPVIIGEQSGVYRFLNGTCSGAGLAPGHSVRVVNVQGYTPDADGNFNHTENDVTAVADHLVTLGQNMASIKEKAKQLRDNLLRMEYDWHGCAQTFMSALSETFQLRLYGQLETATKEMPAIDISTTSSVIEPMHLPVSLRLPAARPWRHMIDPPSQLLAARDEIVPFDKFRQAELDGLVEWIESSEKIELALVTAPGGSGKTRLAFELARHTQRNDYWHSLWLGNDLSPDWEREFRDVLKANDTQHILLVIDYAEARQIELLAIFSTAIELSPIMNGKIRILMLARSAAWWQSLPTIIECNESVGSWLTEKCSTTQIELPSWRSDLASRTESYHAALVAFAKVLETSVPTYTPDLAGDTFSLPVYLHIAALAAINGHRPHSASALLEGQLRHEWRYFRLRNANASYQYDDWADAMAWLVLRQSSQSASFTNTLVKLDINAPDLVSALKQSYPAPGGLTGLQPDLLAECLLRQRLAHDRGALILELALLDDDDAATRDKVLNVLGRLSTNKEGTANEEAALTSWQQVLVHAFANIWPRLGTILIDAAHRSEVGLGVLLCYAWERLSPEIQAELATNMDFPKYSTNLIQLSVLVRRVCVQQAKTLSTRAPALNNLSVSLTYQGDAASRIEALSCARESLEIQRALTKSQRATYLPNLAMSLNNLANRLAQKGDAASKTEALEYARESVEIRRELAETQHTAHQPELAMSLNNLGNRLAEQGDAVSKIEALDCARESVDIQRELTKIERAAYLPDLAMFLNNLANRLAQKGDAASRTEALDCARESVEIRRELTKTDRAAHQPKLALSLNNLANRIGQQKDEVSETEALACAREAVEIQRELTKTQRAAYLPDLAMFLNNLGNRLSRQDDAISKTDALNYARESVEIQRELTKTQRAAYLPDLAMYLHNLAIRLAKQHDAMSKIEAKNCAREAVEIRRELIQTQRTAYLPALAISLNNLANRLAQQDDALCKSEALACAREAVEIQRELTKIQRIAYFPDLAVLLHNLANQLAQESDAASKTEALACAREVVEIRRELTKTQSSANLPDLAMSLNYLANRLAEQRDEASKIEALAYSRESVSTLLLLQTTHLKIFEQQLGIATLTFRKISAQAGQNADQELARLKELTQINNTN